MRLLAFVCLALLAAPAQAGEMSWITVSKDKKRFVLDPSGKPFVPWGFNYDHDADGRLIEDYWDDEWPTVEAHFGQMTKLGANVVRIHPQLGKFTATLLATLFVSTRPELAGGSERWGRSC